MPLLNQSSPSPQSQKARAATKSSGQKAGFWESQKLAQQKAFERKARRAKVKTATLCTFTQQLSSMLEAGLSLVSSLSALEEQTEDPIFRIIIREVRNDVASGTSFSEAVGKFPRAFPNIFVSMVEAGEASGSLAALMGKVATYFQNSVRLAKKIKGAMAYPIAVLSIAAIVVVILMVMVIPKFAAMYADFGKALPAYTQFVINLSYGLKHNILYIIGGMVIVVWVLRRVVATPNGRVMKDKFLSKIPVLGGLIRKVAMARFCRTYAILLKSGVPILRALEIVSKASGNTFVESACHDITRDVSQGGQLSDTIATLPYFPPTVKHMARAGEQTGNVDGMMDKVADYYDNEVNNTVDALTSLMQPLIIVVLGVFVGGIVIAMFLPIFNMASAVGG